MRGLVFVYAVTPNSVARSGGNPTSNLGHTLRFRLSILHLLDETILATLP
jgi:hypothetical protein